MSIRKAIGGVDGHEFFENLFSSPSKQASEAESASQAISQQDIDQAENYVTGSEQQERSAIEGLGNNSYLGAGQQIASTPPAQITQAAPATTPPGTTSATALAPANAFSTPPATRQAQAQTGPTGKTT